MSGITLPTDFWPSLSMSGSGSTIPFNSYDRTQNVASYMTLLLRGLVYDALENCPAGSVHKNHEIIYDEKNRRLTVDIYVGNRCLSASRGIDVTQMSSRDFFKTRRIMHKYCGEFVKECLFNKREKPQQQGRHTPHLVCGRDITLD